MVSSTRGALIIAASILLAAYILVESGALRGWSGASGNSGLAIGGAMSYTTDGKKIYQHSPATGKAVIYVSDYNITHSPVLSPNGEYLAFTEGSASYGRFPKVVQLNEGRRIKLVLDGGEKIFNLLEGLSKTGKIAGKEVVHVFVTLQGWTTDQEIVVKISGDYALVDYEVTATMGLDGKFRETSILSGSDYVIAPTKQASENRSPPKMKWPSVRFDAGSVSLAVFPSLLLLSALAVALIRRNRQDSVRLANGKPPVTYPHEVGYLGWMSYFTGGSLLLFVPDLGGGVFFLSLGALFHFLRIGTLRRKALRDADRSDGQV